jgi:hypothetical protein
MAIKTAQQSLLDLIIRLMPEIKDEIKFIRSKPNINQKSARNLFSIWLDKKNIISDKKFKRPQHLGMHDITQMENDGLIKCQQGEIEITQQGSDVIKTMILGDERSSWEDDGKIFDYTVAHANTKPGRVVKTGKKSGTKIGSVNNIAGGNWYKNLK